MHCRLITPQDDAAIAKIIRDNLKASHLDIPGTAYFDEGLDHLSEYYMADPVHRAYFVVVDDKDTVVGGVGFAEFADKESCAELQKLYLSDAVKGRGYGYEMIQLIERRVRELGYQNLYLETHTNLEAAIHIYEKYGFREIDRQASVVHSTMNKFYEIQLL